ncbi:hypothetical protein KC727_01135 [Candidatus Kaiserbacteria bacterium]|nr:hypothetical protein [Candidatus Kaiserbacteria bacterium]
MNPNQQYNLHEEKTRHHGVVMLLIFVVLIAALAGLYFWGSVLTSDTNTARTPNTNSGGAAVLHAMGPHVDLDVIAADLEAIELTDLDTTLADMENALNN